LVCSPLVDRKLIRRWSACKVRLALDVFPFPVYVTKAAVQSKEDAPSCRGTQTHKHHGTRNVAVFRILSVLSVSSDTQNQQIPSLQRGLFVRIHPRAKSSYSSPGQNLNQPLTKLLNRWAVWIDLFGKGSYDFADVFESMSHPRCYLVRCCPSCRSLDVRRSHRRGLLETVILPLLLLRPFRCEDCTKRHYNLLFTRALQEPSRKDSG